MPNTADLANPTDHAPARYDWTGRHLAALVFANVVLAVGPWFVRLADSGPVSAGFWRVLLPLPLLYVFARTSRQPVFRLERRVILIAAAAGTVFALDLASWHIGIGMTRLGNAVLFGNSGSLILMIWGAAVLRRWPGRLEWTALLSAFIGAAILLGRSIEISPLTVAGDMLCLLAGVLYVGYILLLQGARASIGNWSLLIWASAAAAPVLLVIALILGEPVWPDDWTPLVGLALSSQVIGQGLLVYALRHFPPLFIGMALLIQPLVGSVYGWLAFGEVLAGWDIAGMVLVGAALAMARSRPE